MEIIADVFVMHNMFNETNNCWNVSALQCILLIAAPMIKKIGSFFIAISPAMFSRDKSLC
jgi:hypothetical protein